MNWLKNFDERQQKEIGFSQLYAEQFAHGTDGHNAKIIIARMAGILSRIENILLSEDHPGKWLKIEETMRVSGVGSNENAAEDDEPRKG